MNRIEEFWYCVAPQEDLPLYKGNEISSDACVNLLKLVDLYKEKRDSNDPSIIIKDIILENPSIISDIRVLVGVSDKRLYLDLTHVVNIYKNDQGKRIVEETREHLLKHNLAFFVNVLKNSDMKEELAIEITKYFVSRGLIEILNTFSSLTNEQITQIYNIQIFPKEIQQKDAKLRGHGAEQAFAQIVTACGLSIIPENKDTEPMAKKDPNVDLSNMSIVYNSKKNENIHSFDLIVNDKDSRIKVLIQSLIHSSDPGQYGVNKSDETVDVYKRIRAYNNKLNTNNQIYLLGSVDGVGFSENPKRTIEKMLDSFDDFFQMHTLFKIPIFLQRIGMINNVKGIAFDMNYFEPYAIDHFISKYMAPANIIDMSGEDLSNYKTVAAGKAIVVFN